MKNTKIEYCDMTWNPVSGCLNQCPYCYARKIASRFSENPENVRHIHVLEEPIINLITEHRKPYPCGFDPTLFRYRLREPAEQKESKTIFVCSMADLFAPWIPDTWLDEIFEAVETASQHRYLFLTKYPERYCINNLQGGGYGVPFADNLWYGTTITSEVDYGRFNYLPAGTKNRFVSFEPLLEDIHPERGNILFRDVSWVIIGAETGNRKGKVKPEPEWIHKIVDMADKYHVPVFMKESVAPIVGEERMRRRWPWE